MHKNAQGFSLIEALITLLVLSVGMLGLGQLQARLWAGAGDLHALAGAYLLGENLLEISPLTWLPASTGQNLAKQSEPAIVVRLCELLRQYGAERLAQMPGEPEQTRDRHCRYFHRLLAPDAVLFGDLGFLGAFNAVLKERGVSARVAVEAGISMGWERYVGSQGAVIGIDAYVVDVEVDISAGLPSFTTVGLPEAAVKESKERVMSAIKNSGYIFPNKKVSINLASADVREEGSAFDLPMAIGIIAATGQTAREDFDDYVVLGELSLDGRVKPVRGSLPMALAAKEAGYKAIMVPYDNGREASVVKEIDVLPVESLSQVVSYLRGFSRLDPQTTDISAIFEKDGHFFDTGG